MKKVETGSAMNGVKRFIAEVQKLCLRRHGDRRPKFTAQIKALSEIAIHRYRTQPMGLAEGDIVFGGRKMVGIGETISIPCQFCGITKTVKVGLNDEGGPNLDKPFCGCGAHFFFDYFEGLRGVPYAGTESLSESMVHHYPIFCRGLQLVVQN